MATHRQRDGVWEAVIAEWYPGGIPSRSNSPIRKEVNAAVIDLRDMGATEETITLWVRNCKARQQRARDAWPGGGCTLHACVKHLNNPAFAPTPKQRLEYRYELWVNGLPFEVKGYVKHSMHKDCAYMAWLKAAGTAGVFDDLEAIKEAARKEWTRLEERTRLQYSIFDKRRLLRNEIAEVLAKDLPGGAT